MDQLRCTHERHIAHKDTRTAMRIPIYILAVFTKETGSAVYVEGEGRENIWRVRN